VNPSPRLCANLQVMSVVEIFRVSEDLNVVEHSEVLAKKGMWVKAKMEKYSESKNETLNCKAKVVAGMPCKEITSAAKLLRADVVALGNVARNGLQGLIIGNTAENTVHKLAANVVIVRQ
jgi:universal stress protein E